MSTLYENPWREIIPITLYNYKCFLKAYQNIAPFRFESGSYSNAAHTHLHRVRLTKSHIWTHAHALRLIVAFIPMRYAIFHVSRIHVFFSFSRTFNEKKKYLHHFENSINMMKIQFYRIWFTFNYKCEWLLTTCVKDFAACRLQLGLRKYIFFKKRFITIKIHIYILLLLHFHNSIFRVNHIVNQAKS